MSEKVTNTNNNSNNTKGQLGAAIAGAAVGAAVATAATVLSNEKNRKVLGQKLNTVAKKAQEKWDEAAGAAADRVQEEKKKLEKTVSKSSK